MWEEPQTTTLIMWQRSVVSLNILEQYISRWALPNEEILSWVKWDPSVDFDQVVIRTEADVELTRILNADVSTLVHGGAVEGEIVIGHDMLQIPGFVGFTSAYRLVPESERRICFEVAFVKSGKRLKTVSLNTHVIRPVITIETEHGIDVSDTESPMPPATFNLLNKGKAPPTGFTPFIKLTNAGEMKVTIEHVNEKIPHNPDMPFVRASRQTVPRFALKGSGNALLMLGFKFKDIIGNEYTTETVKINITKPKKKRVEVPIESTLSNQPPIALVLSRS